MVRMWEIRQAAQAECPVPRNPENPQPRDLMIRAAGNPEDPQSHTT
jgi:hypothetical protein